MASSSSSSAANAASSSAEKAGGDVERILDDPISKQLHPDSILNSQIAIGYTRATNSNLQAEILVAWESLALENREDEILMPNDLAARRLHLIEGLGRQILEVKEDIAAMGQRIDTVLEMVNRLRLTNSQELMVEIVESQRHIEGVQTRILNRQSTIMSRISELNLPELIVVNEDLEQAREDDVSDMFGVRRQ